MIDNFRLFLIARYIEMITVMAPNNKLQNQPSKSFTNCIDINQANFKFGSISKSMAEETP